LGYETGIGSKSSLRAVYKGSIYCCSAISCCGIGVPGKSYAVIIYAEGWVRIALLGKPNRDLIKISVESFDDSVQLPEDSF